MLHFYQADNLQILWNRFYQCLKEHQSDSILKPQTILVPNRDIARWVQLNQAKKTGISANLKVLLPAAFIHRLNHELNPDYEQYLPDKQELTWRIYQILLEGVLDKEFSELDHYIANDNLRRYQLASHIADLFDQYMLFRPDWLGKWSAGKPVDTKNPHEAWQRKLWQLLKTKDPGLSDRAVLHRELLRAIKNGTLEIQEPVFVFAIGSVPPIYIETLCTISQITDVFWFRIKIYHENIQRTKSASFYYTGNPIIERFAEEHAAIEGVIHQYSQKLKPQIKSLEPASAPTHPNVLQKLQAQIKNRDNMGNPVFDHSIKVHACHNSFREIEVLQDEILDFLNHTPNAGPGDILIITPDITRYTAFIHAVFGAENNKRHWLPYHINDSSSTLTARLFNVLLAIMRIQKNQFQLSAVLAILDSEPIRTALSLSSDDIMQLEYWLKETGVRWGMDAQQRGDSGVHSWQFGLHRLLMGILVPVDTEDVILGVAPFSDVEGADAYRLIGRLSKVIQTLTDWVQLTSISQTPHEWKKGIEALISFFFPKNEETDKALQPILQSLNLLDDATELLGDKATLSLDIILDMLQSAQNSKAAGTAYRSGGIIFSSMVPVRHLPYRFIGILGLNEATFPGRDVRSSFDLMGTDVRPGDRSIRVTNRGLFLDAILTATDSVHLSYQGFAMSDGSEVPPSLVITELLDFAAKTTETKIDSFITKHRLHAFHPAYFFGNENASRTYNEKRAILAKISQTFREPEMANERLDEPIPLQNDQQTVISLDEVIEFITKPYKWLMENRLSMRKNRSEDLPQDRDPFTLNGLESWKLKQRLLVEIANGENRPDDLYKALHLQGLLEYGERGKRALMERWDETMQFWESIPAEHRESWSQKKKLYEISIQPNNQSINLQAQLPEVKNQNLVLIESSKMKPRRKLKAWIFHLALCTNSSVETFLYTLDGRLHFSNEENAREYLEVIISKMLEIRQFPLPAYANVLETVHEFKDDDIAFQKKILPLFNEDAFMMENTIYAEDDYVSDFVKGYDESLRNQLEEIAELIWKPMVENLNRGEGS